MGAGGTLAPMTEYLIPASHVVPGTAVLVDGDSLVATVTEVRDDALVCDIGTLYVRPTDLVTAC